MAGPTNTQFAVAIHVLTLLTSDAGAPQSSEQMSGSVGANPVYLRRVLGRLREAGLVASRPGPRGGWQLQRPAGEITLGDAWRAVQEGAPIFGLHTVQPGCPVGAAITEELTALDQRLTASVERDLDAISLNQLIPGGTKKLRTATTTVELVAGASKLVKLALPKAARTAVRTALSKRRAVSVSLSAVARDAAGNAGSARAAKVTLRR